MGLFNFLGESALNAVKKSMNGLNNMVNSFEFSDIDKIFDDASKKMNEKIKVLKSRLKETKTTFEINIPYNRDVNTLETKIESNQFTAIVKTIDADIVNSTNVFIPSNVDINSVSNKYDSENNIMYFIFQKKKNA